MAAIKPDEISSIIKSKISDINQSDLNPGGPQAGDAEEGIKINKKTFTKQRRKCYEENEQQRFFTGRTYRSSSYYGYHCCSTCTSGYEVG